MGKNAYLVQLHKIFCWSAPTSSVYFFGHNGLYHKHLSFGAVVSLKFSAIENMPPISVKLRIVYKYKI